MSVPSFIKGPYDTLDYTVDYTAELNRIGETIASSAWVIPSGVADLPANDTIPLDDSVTPNFGVSPSPLFSQGGTDTMNGTIARVFITGGTIGRTYKIQNDILTTGDPPRRYSRQLEITVRAR